MPPPRNGARLLDGAPQDAPWVGFVRAALARVDGAARPLPIGRARATSRQPTMLQRQRNATTWSAAWCSGSPIGCIADGGNVDEWLRLVQAYSVLGDRDKAKDAAADAKRALSDHPDEVKRIDDLVKGLGLNG